MTLKDLLNCRLEDVHLIHSEEEIEPATIVELDGFTLTEEGQRAWEDILDAKVVRIFQGIYGTQIELNDVMPERLEWFSKCLAGLVSSREDKLWFRETESSSTEAIAEEQQEMHTW